METDLVKKLVKLNEETDVYVLEAPADEYKDLPLGPAMMRVPVMLTATVFNDAEEPELIVQPADEIIPVEVREYAIKVQDAHRADSPGTVLMDQIVDGIADAIMYDVEELGADMDQCFIKVLACNLQSTPGREGSIHTYRTKVAYGDLPMNEES